MRRIKNVLLALLSLFCILVPFVAVPLTGAILPPVFENSFVGALDEKVDRLYSCDSAKLVIVGGSSVAFGIDSALIEKYVSMPVVNFGLYAALGTKVMLDLSEDAISEGDIVIIAPELDAQTLSLYFSSSTTLRALDGNFSMLKYLDFEHTFSLLGASWDFTREKIKYLRSEIPDPAGVYNSKNFNSYGDLVWQRNENVMNYYYDPNTSIDLDPSILSEDFCEYLNDYIAKAEKKGASVYFGYCPMNSLALVEGCDPESFAEYLESNIDCNFISDIGNYVYDSGYFYDTNFHLNDAGVKKHTVNLVKDVLLEVGIPTAVKEDVPPPPPLPESDIRYFEEDENAKYFEYKKLPDGTYSITGVKDEFKSETELTVPLGFDTYKVTSIGKSAFEGSSVKKLVVSRDTNLRQFDNGCFNGASSLSELYIYYPYEAELAPPADFVGVANGFKVYVPDGSDYSIGYYWSERGLTFVTINE